MADDESPGTRLWRFWAPNGWAFLWLVFGLMPLLFFQTFVHEWLHWVRTELGGGDATLIPLAHFNTRPGLQRNLNGATLDTLGSPGFPQIASFVFLLALIAVFVLTSPRWRWLRAFLTWWYLGVVLDLLAATGKGLFGASRSGTDWAKFANESGDGTALVLSWAILLAVLSQLLWIRWSRWHLNRPAGVTFWEYRGVAIFLSIVAVIAIFTAVLVDHPTIDRNWWYSLVLVGHIVSLAGYLWYILWVTFKQPGPGPAPGRA